MTYFETSHQMMDGQDGKSLEIHSCGQETKLNGRGQLLIILAARVYKL